MVHVLEHLIGIEHDLMAAPTLNVGHKANTATVVFEGRIVEASLCGKTRSLVETHAIHRVQIN